MNIKYKYFLLVPLIISFLFSVKPNAWSQLADISNTPVKLQDAGPDSSRIRVGVKIPSAYLNMELPLMDATAAGSQSVRLNDYHGKLVILDFWSLGCVSCINAFPKMEELQKKFSDKIKILLVNRQDKNQLMRAKVGKKPLVLPNLTTLNEISYARLAALFPHKTVPHHVWIDHNGTVRAITGSYNTTESHIHALLNNQTIHVNEKMDIDANSVFHTSKRSLRSQSISQELTSSVKYNSMILSYSDLLGNVNSIVEKNYDSVSHTIRNMYINKPALDLYRYAFSGANRYYSVNFGKHFFVDNRILLEVADAAAFYKPVQGDIHHDSWVQKWHFSYEQTYPLSDSAYRFEYMIQDLNRYFRSLLGITAQLANRKVKCLVLIRTSDKDKLSALQNSTSIPRRIFPSRDGDSIFRFINYKLNDIINELQRSNRSILMDIPQPLLIEVDEITNVNMDIKMNFSSLKEIRDALRKYDLDIVECEREIEMLIVKDSVR